MQPNKSDLNRISDSLDSVDPGVRIVNAITLERLASKPMAIPRPDRVLEILLGLRLDEGKKRSLAFRVLRSAFLSGDLGVIEPAVLVAVTRLEDGADVCAPHLLAIRYLKSDRDPSVMERQHPEYRDAILLLVGEFDSAASGSLSTATPSP